MKPKALLPVNDQIFGKLEQIEKRYNDLRYEIICGIDLEYCQFFDRHYRRAPEDASYAKALPGMKWGGNWITAWFRGTVSIPRDADRVFVKAANGGECLFVVNGRYMGVFDSNHPVVMAAENVRKGDLLAIEIEAYSGHYDPGVHPTDRMTVPEDGCRTYEGAELLTERRDVSEFVFDFMTLRLLLKAMDPDSLRRNVILRDLIKVYNTVDMYPGETGEASWRPKLKEADKILKELLAAKNGTTSPFMGITGHSHMDTAWLWPLRETWRKCARTYSNVINLMDRYPEFTFIQSSPCHTEKIREYYPSLFEEIKKQVAAGRYEPNGAMWVEPDCNIPSGEALARQLLVGQYSTREMFGYTSDTLWLPDVFGYSAALPQLLRLAEVRFFLTTKLGWNDTTRHPYDTFVWEGIDGSTVLTHFNTIHSWPSPDHFIGSWKWLQHKTNQDRRFIAYGFGDGGGGVMPEMIEVARRCRDLEGCPRAEHTSVSAFMQSIEERSEPLPWWNGELYLEAHRGTQTAGSELKKANRRAEFVMRDAEILSAAALVARQEPYPGKELLGLWKMLLTNQFHDIIPGDGIREVVEEGLRDYETVICQGSHLRDKALDRLTEPCPGAVTLFNTLSWERSGEVSLPAGVYPAGALCQDITDPDGTARTAALVGALPPMAAVTAPLAEEPPQAASPFRVTGSTIETPFAVAELAEDGSLRSLVDKASDREVTCGRLNRFYIGEDVPEIWDNWNIDKDQKNKMAPAVRLTEREIIADGPLQLVVRSRYALSESSSMVQDTVFHSSTCRIDFKTLIDWHDKHTLLKASFDLDVLADFSRSEIQYGFAERPTHTNRPDDAARFEVCCHKWADLSETGFGCAVINDSKYGLSIEERNISLTLIKSGTHPDPTGDEGVHSFSYALLPHDGGFGVRQVTRPAYEFNLAPLTAMGRTAPKADSLISLDRDNIIAEAVKQSEDGSGITVRLWEAEKTGTKVRAAFGFDFAAISEVNLLEEKPRPVRTEGRTAFLTFRPFEIKTLKITF